MTTSFTTIPLREELQKNIISLNYTEMTPIQSQSLPLMLDNKDIIAQAKTGSGKTAAFGLALLNKLKVDIYAVQALVLCPTRELAEQVSVALRQLARLLPNVKVLNLSGGLPLRPQMDSLRHGAHIIVGTPGRVLKHLEKETLSLNRLETLVLDEADRMLDMGFFDDMKTIFGRAPLQRQTLLFSATYPDEIKKLSKQFMKNPQEILIAETHTPLEIEQHFYEVKFEDEKFSVLKSLLQHHQPASTLIFCNTKQQTTELTKRLIQSGYSAAALNGDMEQVDRDIALIAFVNQSCSILVATDVAARGLDIKELPAVINYDLAFEHDVHVHRIGRTGRAGCRGLALSITTPKDAERLCAIEDHMQAKITFAAVDQLKALSNKILTPKMVMLCLSAGKKEKIRPGDILGALTKDAGIEAVSIGKIDITLFRSYVAVTQKVAEKAFQYLQQGKLKGRKVNVKRM